MPIVPNLGTISPRLGMFCCGRDSWDGLGGWWIRTCMLGSMARGYLMILHAVAASATMHP
jgi:hypothetical protein